MFTSLVAVLLLCIRHIAGNLANLRTFGDAISTEYGGINQTDELTIYEYSLSYSEGRAGVMTYLQMLAGKGSLGRYISDTMIMRIYVDNNSSASLTFSPAMAAGSGVALEGLKYYMTDGNNAGKLCEHGDLYCGMDLLDGWPWETKYTGKLGGDGVWFIKLPVPFLKSLKVTVQLSNNSDIPTPKPPSPWTGYGGDFAIRGVEGPESDIARHMAIGGIDLPPIASWNVKLNLFKLENHVARPMEFVPLVNFTGSANVGGALLMTTINANMAPRGIGATLQGGAVEGCVWALLNPSAQLKQGGGAVKLGTGFEDFFGSSFGFSYGSKRTHGLSAGLSHLHGGPDVLGKTKSFARISAYKFWDADPLIFNGGRFELVWRNGAATVPDSHGVPFKCTLSPHATSHFGGRTIVDSYQWVYTWEEPDTSKNRIEV